LDFYVIHRYPFGPGNLDYVGLLMDPTTAWPVIGNNLRQMLDTYSSNRSIEVAVNEYNSYWDEPEILAIQTVNMLYLADTLGQIIEQGFSYANHWDILNGTVLNNSRYGLLLEDQGNYRQPSYYVYPLWSRAGDQHLTSSGDLDPGMDDTLLDVDDNGQAKSLTDGLLVLRYLFGFRGETLTDSVVAPDCQRCTAEAIEDYVQDYVP